MSSPDLQPTGLAEADRSVAQARTRCGVVVGIRGRGAAIRDRLCRLSRRRCARPAYELLLDPTPLPPKPEEPEEDDPTLPREPADTVPALRLAVLDELEELFATDVTLLPAEALLTPLATVAALLVAALTRALVSAAALLVAATPPPVPAA